MIPRNWNSFQIMYFSRLSKDLTDLLNILPYKVVGTLEASGSNPEVTAVFEISRGFQGIGSFANE